MTSRSLERAPRNTTVGHRQVDQRRGAIDLETIGKVAAVLGHESRNLLGALGTCGQILRRNPHLTADDLELLDIMQGGANRLSEIVGQFAMFRRAEPANFSALDPCELIEQTLAKLRRDDRCSPLITIERRFDPSVALIQADQDGLRCLFWEIFLNAVQAMGERGTLRIETRRGGKDMLIVVKDTGPGIAAGNMRKIFAPLFTTKTRAAGLGLAIVKRVVGMHGGRVRVNSTPGAGATFTIALPVRAKTGEQPNSPRRARREVD